MMPLYFPEDKTEYIIPAIVCFLFIIGAIATWRMFIRVSKREAERMQKLEQTLLAEKKR
ncbi:hypothetical protein QUF88_25425 [Bacillus sp. DX1.1]|uniref:hypothetical protein n=1 Tax=unclassified Bacillus (in: firmicutes) TaxID=185979 RepID=UPI00256FFB40|nr:MULTISPECIES: hypothetical protein [unclassified Bacillus (in: firmicutes)]MDM5157027.1 hypothetical protein [Bacillus sp. DX1.1]MDM5190540.1 hypothetical protein [Bacillus sp. DX4.1]WJE81264.1 hypothetical protein QRE67_22965 [Bacillus sp. DX3.1]